MDLASRYGVLVDLELVELRCLVKKIRSRAHFGGSRASDGYRMKVKGTKSSSSTSNISSSKQP